MLKKITVLYNRPDPAEADIVLADEDTRISAIGVAKGLSEIGYEAEVIGIDESEINVVKQIKTDLVFNLVEWAGKNYIRGVKVIEELERSGLAYTGSRAWGYKASCDKILMKKIFAEAGIETPKWQIFTTGREKVKALPYPVIAKPVYEHCAIGIDQKSVVANESELRDLVLRLVEKYEQPVLAEEYIDGREAHVTILSKNGRPWVLPPAVLEFDKKPGYRPILTYESKWLGGWEEKMSSWMEEIGEALERKIKQAAARCNTDLGGRSYSRVDMRMRDGKVYVLEINNNPGIDFEPSSGIAYSAKKAGLSWHGLLENIVTEAYEEGRAYVPAFA